MRTSSVWDVVKLVCPLRRPDGRLSKGLEPYQSRGRDVTGVGVLNCQGRIPGPGVMSLPGERDETMAKDRSEDDINLSKSQYIKLLHLPHN